MMNQPRLNFAPSSRERQRGNGNGNATPAAEIISLPLSDIRPSPENDELYHPVSQDDPAFSELVSSIRTNGMLEPIVITLDGWIVSGHRRHAAATVAGLNTVPCRRHQIRREDDPDEFVKLLAECNRQRVKTFDERVREELVSVDTADAYAHLKEYRRKKSTMSGFCGKQIEFTEEKCRSEISKAKIPLLTAVQKIVEDYREYWPLSDRRIHYLLLNDPPLTHASKPDSTYQNTPQDYKNQCVDILTRGRLAGLIPWESIEDETRPFTPWNVWREPSQFVKEQTDRFLKGYWRDLMQSQPAHIEIIAEKLTVRSTVEKVAMDFCIPVTIGRGYSSLDPRYKMAERFKASGRDRLVLLLVSDFDPEGQDLARNFAQTMRDDFGIIESKITAVKVGLNRE